MKSAIISTILLVLTTTQAFATGGGAMGGGGGGVIAADFVKYARFALNAMKSPNQTVFSISEANAIDAAITKTEVFGEPNDFFCTVYMDTASGDTIRTCEDAHYFPESASIKVNQDTWKNHSCMKRMSVVLHEYGRVAGLENANYTFSSKLFQSQAFSDACVFIRDQEKIDAATSDCNNLDCKPKIDALVEIMETTCYLYLKKIPVPVVTQNDQMIEYSYQLEFDRCTRVLREEWKKGFGQKCQSAEVQESCFKSCKQSGFLKYCFNQCSLF